jgi:hypothetical protein
MYVDSRRLKLVISQRDEIQKWLETNASFATDEQKQLEANTPERAYWHYGYQAALTDMINLLVEPRSSDSVGNLN